MKKLLITILLAAAGTLSTFAQGTVTFGNTSGLFATPADRYVYAGQIGNPANLLKGTQYRAQLYWSVTSSGTFEAVDSNPAAFRSTSTTLPGTWVQQDKIVPAAQGSTVFLQVRVWDSTGGSSYETSSAYARSDTFSWRVPVTGDPPTAAIMENLRAIGPMVPEPSTFALAGVGLIGLVMARRRK